VPRFAVALAVSSGWLVVAACGSHDSAPIPSEVAIADASFAPERSVDAALEASVHKNAASPEDAGPLPGRAFDWWGTIHTGQSLSVGAAGGTPNPAAQPYANLMLNDATGGYDDVGDELSLKPLTSPIRPGPYTSMYPSNIGGETPAEGMANQLSALAAAQFGISLVSIPSVVGQGGKTLNVIERQSGPMYPAPNPSTASRAYWASLYEVTHIQRLAQASGKRYGVGAIVLTHGENDALLPNQTEEAYAAGLVRLIANYREDLLAITHQTLAFPLLLTQQHSVPGGADLRSRMTLAQRAAAAEHPEAIVLVGPKYQYEYAADRIHLAAPAYERLGEKYGEVFARVVLQGGAFRALSPTRAERVDTQIRVHFDVPFTPLEFESAFPVFPDVAHPWHNGRGFEVTDANGTKVTIVSAEIDNSNTVLLTLDRAPSAGSTVAYALTQAAATGSTSNYAGGLAIGRHGNLHDSDPFVPRDRATLVVTASGSTLQAPQAFVRRTVHDRVTFAEFPGEWTVVARMVDSVTLDRPTAHTGTVHATFASDQRNYAVAFSLAVP
jgi:hypothetical protein